MIWQRIKNIWALSAYQPEQQHNQGVATKVINNPVLVKNITTDKAIFIPRIKKSPIEQVTEVANTTA